MLKSWFTALFCAVTVAFSGVVHADDLDARADAIAANFTVNDLLGQMNQVAITTILETNTNKLNETTVRRFAKERVGSYLTSPFFRGLRNGERSWTAQQWRDLMTRIQEITMEENGGHPMIYGIDAAHGSGFVKGTVVFPHTAVLGSL